MQHFQKYTFYKILIDFVDFHTAMSDLYVSQVFCLCVFQSVPIRDLGAVSIRKTVLPGMAIPMLKIRRPNGRLIFNMEIAIRR